MAANPAGSLETIPAKMIKEIPLPIPFSVILSPNHIKNAVPAVKVSEINKILPKEGLIKALLKPKEIPIA